MKVSSLLLFPVAAEAASIWPRQLAPSLKFAGSSKLTPEARKGAIRVLQKLGPISIRGKGSAADSGQQNFRWALPRDSVCRDCTVLKGHIGLADMNGNPIVPTAKSGVYIHHILTYDSTKKSNAFVSGCPDALGAILGSKFVGTGEDNNNVPVWYTNKDGTHRGGFHVGASDSFTMLADLVSMNPSYTQIYLTFDIEYLPGIVGSDTRETLLSVDTCGGQALKPSDNGTTITRSGKYTFKESGSILLAKGHLHSGGDKIQLFVNNKVVCESKAIYGGQKGEAAIGEMTLCPEIQVKAGDVMTFSAVYDTTKHKLHTESHGLGMKMPDVMGMFDVVFSKQAG